MCNTWQYILHTICIIVWFMKTGWIFKGKLESKINYSNAFDLPEFLVLIYDALIFQTFVLSLIKCILEPEIFNIHTNLILYCKLTMQQQISKVFHQSLYARIILSQHALFICYSLFISMLKSNFLTI